MTEKKNENLIQELYKEMEEELERDPEVMDTYKIRDINRLIVRLEGREELPLDMGPEQFLSRFNKKFGLDLQPMPVEPKQSSTERKKAGQISWKVRLAMAAVIIAVLAGIGNRASIMAADKSLCQIIKGTTHSVFADLTLGVLKDDTRLMVVYSTNTREMASELGTKEIILEVKSGIFWVPVATLEKASRSDARMHSGGFYYNDPVKGSTYRAAAIHYAIINGKEYTSYARTNGTTF